MVDARGQAYRARKNLEYYDFVFEDSSDEEHDVTYVVRSDMRNTDVAPLSPSPGTDLDLPGNNVMAVAGHPEQQEAPVHLQEQLDDLQQQDLALSTSNVGSSDKSINNVENNNHCNYEETTTLAGELARWVMEANVRVSQASSLLKILHKHHPELPTDARALLKSGRREKVAVEEMEPGTFFYYGIENRLQKILSTRNIGNVQETIQLAVASDGVHLTYSSLSKFNPICGKIIGIIDSPIFLIGIYHGFSKPSSSNEYLMKFVAEAKTLYQDGFYWNGRRFRVVIKYICADAEMRAWLTCTLNHTAKNGCSRCDGNGVRYSLPRTNANYRQQEFGPYHHDTSILTELDYFDMIFGIPLDPMHLIDLGVMRRQLKFIVGTSRNFHGVTLSAEALTCMDSHLKALKAFISRKDFARQPRTFKEVPRWKAVEYRLLLRYIGIPLFKRHLTSHHFQHFLLLHAAVKLFSEEPWCYEDNDLARHILTLFVQHSPELYTTAFLCYNVHCRPHVAEDVRRHGQYSFSAYSFENFAGNR